MRFDCTCELAGHTVDFVGYDMWWLCRATICSLHNMLPREAYCVPCLYNMLPESCLCTLPTQYTTIVAYCRVSTYVILVVVLMVHNMLFFNKLSRVLDMCLPFCLPFHSPTHLFILWTDYLKSCPLLVNVYLWRCCLRLWPLTRHEINLWTILCRGQHGDSLNLC